MNSILSGRGLQIKRKLSISNQTRLMPSKPFKKSPMEEQSFLSTLPLRMKSRRRRASTNTSRPGPSISERAVQGTQEDVDHDWDETSSDDEPGKARNAIKTDGKTTPSGHTSATGFIGPSCGKDAPNVHFVSPLKDITDVFSRPDLVDGSRYYVKRRIKIGNSSKYIPEGKYFRPGNLYLQNSKAKS